MRRPEYDPTEPDEAPNRDRDRVAKRLVAAFNAGVKLSYEQLETVIIWERARDTNARLNRRAQTAEAAAGEWREVSKLSREQRTGRFFPALAALAVVKAEEENAALKAELDKARQQIAGHEVAAAALIEKTEQQQKRIAELEALLEKSEHGVCAETGARCRPWCIRCEWEKMKGGAE